MYDIITAIITVVVIIMMIYYNNKDKNNYNYEKAERRGRLWSKTIKAWIPRS